MRTVTVKAVRVVDSPPTVCEVTVADNHNLYVSAEHDQISVLVHNCLDENRKYLQGKPFNTPHGGLAQIYCTYGNDHYYTAKFGKEDRANANLTRLDNPDFLVYAATDVVSIYHMRLMQLKRAEYLKLGENVFKPYYRKLVNRQMSNTVHVTSHMRQRGVAIDKAYLALLKSNQSPLRKLIEEEKQTMTGMPEVVAANKTLLKENTGTKGKGLFNRVINVFDFGKPEHQMLLFFSTMGLKPVSHTATGKPQVNKTFIGAYKYKYPLVEKFGRYVKMNKLLSAYVKGWWNKLQASIDSQDDWRLRADYGFFEVVTGRLNSKDPSLQQVPTRGKEAKYIKRSFVAPPGTIHVKYDYSAHEVRGWSFVSFDQVLAAVFKVGQKLRQQLRMAKTDKEIEEVQSKLKKEGDVHILNVKRFFNMWVAKDHPLRDAIKQVVFGVIYGKAAKTLARDIRAQQKNQSDEIIYNLTKEKERLLLEIKNEAK